MNIFHRPFLRVQKHHKNSDKINACRFLIVILLHVIALQIILIPYIFKNLHKSLGRYGQCTCTIAVSQVLVSTSMWLKSCIPIPIIVGGTNFVKKSNSLNAPVSKDKTINSQKADKTTINTFYTIRVYRLLDFILSIVNRHNNNNKTIQKGNSVVAQRWLSLHAVLHCPAASLDMVTTRNSNRRYIPECLFTGNYMNNNIAI